MQESSAPLLPTTPRVSRVGKQLLWELGSVRYVKLINYCGSIVPVGRGHLHPMKSGEMKSGGGGQRRAAVPFPGIPYASSFGKHLHMFSAPCLTLWL